MTQATTTALSCPLWRRLLALVYDVVAVLAIVMTVGLVCELVTRGQLITTQGAVHIAWWYQPLQALVVATYFLLSWLRGGQTLGMRPWHIRVMGRDGARLTMRMALLRLVVAALPLLLLVLAPTLGWRPAIALMAGAWIVWFAIALFDPRRRALHDLLAGTELQRLA